MNIGYITNNRLNYNNFISSKKSEDITRSEDSDISKNDTFELSNKTFNGGCNYFEIDKAKEILESLNRERDDLDENQIKILKEKYADKGITKETYQSFLNDLVDMGIITTDEKYFLGGKDDNDPEGLTRVTFPFSGVTVAEAKPEYSHMSIDFSMLSKGIDITDWVKYRVS